MTIRTASKASLATVGAAIALAVSAASPLAAHCAGGWVTATPAGHGASYQVEGLAWKAGAPVTLKWMTGAASVVVRPNAQGSFRVALAPPVGGGFQTLVASQGREVFRAQVERAAPAVAPASSASPSPGALPVRLPLNSPVAGLLLVAIGAGLAVRRRRPSPLPA